MFIFPTQTLDKSIYIHTYIYIYIYILRQEICVFRISNDSQALTLVNYRAWNQLNIGRFGHENGMSQVHWHKVGHS